MSFTIRVTGGVDRGVQGGAEKLVTTLEKGEAQAKRTGDAVARAGRDGSSSLMRTERAAGQARDALGRFTRDGASSMSRLAGATGSLSGELNRLAMAIGAVFTARVATGLLDGYTQIGNRLNTVAKDQANLNGLLEASHGIAQDTYTDWKATTEAVVRFTNATAELGKSQRDVLDFTTALNKAIILSGAAGSEASSGLLQLSQGLAKGTLDGEELKSVLENLPYVASIIARGMGKTRGELKRLGAEGKITAKEVFDAITKAAPDIEARFGKVVPTIAQNFTRLRNEATKFFGEAGTGSGLLRGLGDAFNFVIENFDTFARALLGVGQALLGLFVISKVIALVKALGLAIAANPLGALVVALTVGVALLRQFGDQLDAGHDGITKVSDVLGVLWEDLKALGGAILDFVSGAWSALTGAFSDGLDGAGIELSFKNVLLFLASFVDSAIGMFRFLGKSIVDIFTGVPKIIGAVIIEMGRVIVGGIQLIINGLIEALNAVLRVAHEVKNLVTGTIDMKGIAARAREGQAKGLTGEALKQYALAGGGGGGAAYQIPTVDLDFRNPLAGAAGDLGRSLAANFREWLGTSVARDYITGVFDRAAERAAGRPAPTRGTISDVAGRKGKPVVSKEEESAAKKLARELEAIRSASNPITEAQMKLAKAVEVTDRAMRAGLIAMEEANALVSETAAKTADARDPLLAWRRELEAETAALGMSNGERERMNAILRATEDLRQRGVDINAATRADIEREIDLQRSAAAAAKYNEERQRDLQGALNEIRSAENERGRSLDLVNQLQRDGAITAEEYERSIRKIELAYLGSSEAGRTFEGGIQRGLLTLRDEITDIGSQIESALTNAFHSVEQAIVDLVTTGEISWKRMVDSMLADMTRLLLRQGIAALLGLGGGGTASVFGTGATQAFAGLFGSAPGFAHGGQMRVSGRGGIDTNLAMLRVSNGETITVTPQGQPAPGSGSPQRVTVVLVDERNEARRFAETEGEAYHLAYARRNEPAKRGRTTGR